MWSKDAERLMDKWISDDAFRAAMRRDPAAAVKAAGLQLTEEEQAALKENDWSLSDEELVERASKAGS